MCVAEKHKLHTFIKLAEASGTFRQEIEVVVQVAVSALTEAADGIAAVEDRRKEVESSTKSKEHGAHQKVQAFFKKLQAAFIARMKVVQAAALAEGGRKEDVLVKQKYKLEAAHQRLESGLALATRFLESGSDVELMQIQRMLIDGLKAAAAHGVALEPNCGPSVLFVEGEELLSFLEKVPSLGIISGSDTNPAACTAEGAGGG